MGPKNDKLQIFSRKNVVVGRNSGMTGSDRVGGRIEAGKTHRGRARGGPSGIKNGHLWPKLWSKFGQIFGHHPGDPYHSDIYIYIYIYGRI